MPCEQQPPFSFQFTFKKPPKARQHSAKATHSQTTDPDPQDALNRYNGLKSMAELSGESLQQLASEKEWGVFQGMGWV